MLYLHRDSMKHVTAWLARSGVTEGRLFRSLRKDGAVGAALHSSQVPRIYKSMAAHAALPTERVDALAGHSTRVGAVQDMIAMASPCPQSCRSGAGRTPSWCSATESGCWLSEAPPRGWRGCRTAHERPPGRVAALRPVSTPRCAQRSRPQKRGPGVRSTPKRVGKVRCYRE